MCALAVSALGLTLSGLAVTPAAAAPEPKIWGVVVDQGNRPVLDVTVQAVNQRGVVAASDLSYDDPDGNSAPRPGYFGLFVGGKGTYDVTFSKKGYFSRTVEEVTVARGGWVRALGDVVLQRKPQESKTSAKLADSSITTSEKGRVTVSVGCDDVACDGLVPTGKVTVTSDGDVLGSGVLRPANKGKLTIVLGKLGRGSYALRASYKGDEFLKASGSRAVTLKVTRPSRTRPNARAWIG
ncbi:Ig-like domain repeat protein [Nocardioides sp. GCM10027113]|uniref:Ig-like domain repeat protein n=1 Tax=unclassified Nocardioides TaxID=2615069 RepID=UPI0036214326